MLIARALCAAKRALFMDEPASALDAAGTEDFHALLRALRSETGLAVVMVTHDRERAEAEATHLLVLGERQEFFGAAQDYREWTQKNKNA